jgi:periplasmic protein TonB
MRKPSFTIYHSVVASSVLHLVLALPFVLRFTEPTSEASTLAIELQGVVADIQAEEKTLQETKGQEQEKTKGQEQKKAKEQEQETAPQLAQKILPDPPASETQPLPSGAEGVQTPTTDPQLKETQTPRSAPPEKETPSTAVGSENAKGDAERERAKRLKLSLEENSRLLDYVKLLTKRVQSHLVYPSENRSNHVHGAAKVSFRVLSNGQISPASLKVIESSGRSELDASALKTVRSSVPFAPPPKEVTVSIAVAFGH